MNSMFKPRSRVLAILLIAVMIMSLAPVTSPAVYAAADSTYTLDDGGVASLSDGESVYMTKPFPLALTNTKWAIDQATGRFSVYSPKSPGYYNFVVAYDAYGREVKRNSMGSDNCTPSGSGSFLTFLSGSPISVASIWDNMGLEAARPVISSLSAADIAYAELTTGNVVLMWTGYTPSTMRVLSKTGGSIASYPLTSYNFVKAYQSNGNYYVVCYNNTANTTKILEFDASGTKLGEYTYNYRFVSNTLVAMDDAVTFVGRDVAASKDYFITLSVNGSSVTNTVEIPYNYSYNTNNYGYYAGSKNNAGTYEYRTFNYKTPESAQVYSTGATSYTARIVGSAMALIYYPSNNLILIDSNTGDELLNTTDPRVTNAGTVVTGNQLVFSSGATLVVDYEALVIDGVDIKELGTFGVDIHVLAKDDGVIFNSIDGGATWKKGLKNRIIENGTYTVLVKDGAGNIEESDPFTVSNAEPDGYYTEDIGSVKNGSAVARIHNTGTLEIYGSGTQATYSSMATGTMSAGHPLFYNEVDFITNVKCASNVSTIGAYLLSGLKVQYVVLPENPVSPNADAFTGMPNLKYIYNYCPTTQTTLATFLSAAKTPAFIKAYGPATNVGFKTKVESMGYVWEELTELNAPQKTVVSSAIDASKPYKKIYKVGDSLDVTNMFVKTTYSDGTTSSTQVTEPMVSGFDSVSLGTKTLTIDTGTATCATTITVQDRVTTLALQPLVYKTAYIKGQTLDLTNVSVLATKESGAMEVISVTSDMVTGYNPSTLGLQIVTITKDLGSCQYQVTVTNPITEITMEPGNTTTYAIGSSIDLASMTVRTNYQNGETTTSAVTADMVSGFDTATAGNKTVTVTKDGQTCIFTITVIDQVNSIVPVINPADTRTTYVQGEELDLTGMDLTVVAASGTTTIPITSDMITGFDPNTPGTQTVTVTYQGQTSTFTVDVKGVDSVTGFGTAPKLTYNTGEAFTASGASITVQTTDGGTLTVPIDPSWVSTVDTSTPGTKTVTVTVGGVDYTFDIEVLDGAAIVDIELIGVKTTYKQNQAFVAQGQVKLIAQDGSSSFVDITADMSTAFNTSVLGAKTATITTNGISKNYSIEVGELAVKSISIVTPKADYIQNQAFVAQGKIEITYEDDSTKLINLINMYAIDFDSSTIGTHTVTVEYGGQSTTYDINVSAKSISNIDVMNARTEYIQNEVFYKAGKLKVDYSDGSTEYVTLTSSLITSFDTSQPGQVAVEVSYGGYAETYLINVTEFTAETPVGITVTDTRSEAIVKSTALNVDVTGLFREVIAPNGAKIYSNNFNYSVYENGTYNFSVLGRDGESTSSCSIYVVDIDTTAPVITFGTVGGDITQVSVNASDASGIDKAYDPNGNEITLPFTFDATTLNGTFRVVDVAGNEASKDYLVSSVVIGASATPTFVALDGIPDSWTNQPADVTFGAQNTVDGVTEITTSEDSLSGAAKTTAPKFASSFSPLFASNFEDFQFFAALVGSETLLKTVTVADNKTIDYTVVTQTGSYTNSVTIDKIDMVDPTATIAVNGDDITVTAGDNASGVSAIILPNGSVVSGVAAGNTSDVSDSFTMQGNGTFTIFVMDHAGNVIEKTFTITSENPNGVVTPDPVDNGGGNGGGSGGSGPVVTPPVVPTPNTSNIAIKESIGVKSGIKGYVKGYENNVFKPNDFITRAEVAQIIANIVKSEGSILNDCNDTTNAWYTAGVNKTVGLGIMKGYPNKTFKPNSSITRQELAITLCNLLDIDKSYGTTKAQLNDISNQYGKSSIEFLAALDVVHGYADGSFKPNNKITRAEAVTMINNLLAAYLTNDSTKEVTLKDISNSWAKDDIVKAFIAE